MDGTIEAEGEIKEIEVEEGDPLDELLAGEPEDEDSDEHEFASSTSPEEGMGKFDFEIARPVAHDLTALADNPEISAAARTAGGVGRNVLVVHGLTPFAKPGQRPKSVAELGYETSVLAPIVRLIAFAPKSFARPLASGSVGLTLGLSANGCLDLGELPIKAALTPAAGALGVLVGASVDASAGVAAKCQLSLAIQIQAVKLQSGPTSENGGTRWQLYKDRESLAVFQPLIQVIAVPYDLEVLIVRSQAWIRRRRSSLRRAPVWITEIIEFQVPLPSA
jgi:hypothetical protein